MSMGSTRDMLMEKNRENSKPVSDYFSHLEKDDREQNKESKKDKGASANEDTPDTKKQKENLSAIEENYYNLSKPILLTNIFVN